MAEKELAVEPISKISWIWGWLPRWNFYEFDMLRQAERKILSILKTPYKSKYVDIGPTVGVSDKIWTLALNEESTKTPILLLHGLAAGVALWCLNLDSFAAHRPVYAIDVLGFGSSSRPNFSSDAKEAEKQLVQSVEQLRKELKLEKMILLGHSMGGYVAASYAIEHPDRVKHLILADPWGFPERPVDPTQKYKLPFWFKAVSYVGQKFYPLAMLRASGPFGEWLIKKVRPDIVKKFEPFLKDDIGAISQYIYHCNAQKPSGESVFYAMMSGLGWAKNPMIKRVHTLRPDIPMTLIYGFRSWVDNSTGEKIQEQRGPDAYVNVIIIPGAGHHVYADKHEAFNKQVNDVCQLSDNGQDNIVSKEKRKKKDSVVVDEQSQVNR